MAIKMQQRRGTAAQWTTANPILAAGEVGYETDTFYFKIGDGINHWADLVYFVDGLGVDGKITNAISTEVTNRNSAISVETTNRNLAIASAISDEEIARDQAIATAVGAHESDTTNVHGIPDTSALATKTYSDSAVSTHSSTTTNVHGISNTANLVTKAGVETLTNKTISAADNTVTVNLADVVDITATVSEVNKLAGLSTTKTELGYVNGVTSAIQTQIDAKAPTSNPTFTGTLNAATVSISGNLTVGGTTTTVNAANLTVADPLVYFGEGNTSNVVDLGFVASYNDGTYHHAGLARDASDNKWKLFSSVEDEPTTTINFAQAEYDTLVVGGIEYSDGVQVKQGVPSLTSINQQTASYTSVLSDRDKLVEINSASGVTLTIPANSSVAYPVGTSFDILQTGAGQITIAGAGGVTVNATPGLKLRTQWSSATLFKRATDTWVVFGDLSA